LYRYIEDALNQLIEAGLAGGGGDGEDPSVVVSSIYGRVKFKCVGVDERSEEGRTLHEKAVVGVRPDPPGRENLGPGWHPRWGTVYKLHSVDPYSLKAPGFNPRSL
jgi:hypothetical protein